MSFVGLLASSLSSVLPTHCILPVDAFKVFSFDTVQEIWPGFFLW